MLGPLRAPPSGAAPTPPATGLPLCPAGALPPEWGKSPFSQRHLLGRGPAVCPRRAWGAQPILPTAGPEGGQWRALCPRDCRSVVHNAVRFTKKMPLTLDTGGNKPGRAPRAGRPTGQRVPVNTAHGARLTAVLHLRSLASAQRPCPTAPGFLLRRGRARENPAADQSLSRESERSLRERPVKSRWEGPENKR